MSKHWDLALAALFLLPFVAVGAALYALLWGLTHAWDRSRVVVRNLSLTAVTNIARRELEEDEATRRNLAGSAWDQRVWIDCDDVELGEGDR